MTVDSRVLHELYYVRGLSQRQIGDLIGVCQATVSDYMQLYGFAPRKNSSILSPRRQAVLALMGEGLSNRQIGQRLGLAEKTIKNYVSDILHEIGCATRTQAAIWWIKNREQGVT